MGSWLRRLWIGVRWSRYDHDLREELDAHRALRQAQLERDGMRPDAAERASRQALGNVLLSREDARDIWLGRAADELRQDVRLGARALAAHRGVTALAVLSLALGIGANAAAFSVLKAILLTPLPYPAPERLVRIGATTPAHPGARALPTVPEYVAWKAHAELFDAVASFMPAMATLGADGPDTPAEEVVAQGSTASLFQVLGVPPLLGRTFTEAEDPLDAPAPVVLISEDLWRRRFGGDGAVLTRSLRLDGQSMRIIGVMSTESSPVGEHVDVWRPVNWHHSLLDGSARGWAVVARLKPGVTLVHAQTVMSGVVTNTIAETGGSESWRAAVDPLQDAMYRGYVAPLFVLQGIVGVVLLIACANVAGLLLARAAGRRTEMAIRAAIGAGRRRLVRQLLTESLLLAGLGGLAAVGVAWITLRLLIAASPGGLPRSNHIGLDAGVFVFTALISGAAALVFGMLPALQASRADPIDALKPSARTPPGVGRVYTRGGLVILQIALAVVLLIASGLLIRTLMRVGANDLHADPHGVAAFDVRFAGSYHKIVASYNGFPLLEVSPLPARVFEDVRGRLERVPGVESAGAIDMPPFTGVGPAMTFALDDPEGHASVPRSGLRTIAYIATPHFFRTMRIALLRGRDFTDGDDNAAPWVAIINEAMAKTFWPGEDPLGQRLRLDLVPDEQPREIVGVVADVRSNSVETIGRPALYTSVAQQPVHNRAPFGEARLKMTFVVRTADDPMALAPAIQRVMADVDPDRPAIDIHPLDDDVSNWAATPRYAMTVINTFAAVATLLAAVGLYGVIAQSLEQRRKELAVRMALGARQADVWRLALGQVGVLLATGLAVGLASALLFTRVLTSLLWQISPTDGPTYAAVATLMTLVAGVAAAIPIGRAARTAPAAVLKIE